MRYYQIKAQRKQIFLQNTILSKKNKHNSNAKKIILNWTNHAKLSNYTFFKPNL